MKDQTLYVIAVTSNSVRYKSRTQLMKDFKVQMSHYPNVKLVVVETAFGERPFEVTEPNNPYHIQLRSFDELWHKENMINIGIQQLYRIDPQWQYMAWIDADISFSRPDWAVETIQKLQHHHVIQLFSTCIDMGPNQEIIQTHKSFAWCWRENKFEPDMGNIVSSGPYHETRTKKYFWHPGYAWAARREALEELSTYASGPLIDYPCIIGSGDHHMALGLIGLSSQSYPGNVSNNYKKAIDLWQDNALNFVKKDIGYIDCTIVHHWHGKKADRRYGDRWNILTSNEFNPETDIRKDHQGLMILIVRNERQRRLRDQLRDYFTQRNEDSIDL